MSVCTNPWYFYFLNQAHSAIDSGYANAIANFAYQKRSFLKQLQPVENLAIQDFMKKINEEVEKETEEELDKTFDKAFAGVQSQLEDFFGRIITGEGVTGFADLKKRYDYLVKEGQAGKVKPERLYDNLIKDIEKFLTQNDITKTGLAAYIGDITNLGKTSENTDIQNNLYGYARKLVLEYLQSGQLQHSTQHFKASLKGYYKEELLVPVFEKVLKQYGANIGAQQAGSLTNAKGQQIQYDIILGTFSGDETNEDLNTMINRMESLGSKSASQSITTVDPKIIGGIQSKSWVTPWSNVKGGNRSWLSFGNHSELIPTGNGKYYWHAGVNNVMRNLSNIIGINNFIFSTGGEVYFTADLLKDFKEAGYVFGFNITKNEGIRSGAVAAQSHND